MLGRFVISAAQLDKLSPVRFDWPFAVLSDSDHHRAATVESKKIVAVAKPIYCEASIDQLDEIKKAGAMAKIRTGGLVPEAVPSVDTVAAFITACADRRLPFKATAGLHHPIQSATMHGFINVFIAAAFAWRGERKIEGILAETDPAAFWFDDQAHWRDRALEEGEIAAARRQFAHSFGSCSFEEPLSDLHALGWL